MQLLDERAQRGIVEMCAAGCAKFRSDPAGARLPVADQGARARLQKDEAKQIALASLIEPSDE
jgi:hypothetical protein